VTACTVLAKQNSALAGGLTGKSAGCE